jgi:hypothetical protein
MVINADILTKDGAAPAIVVPRDHQYWCAGFPQLGKSRKNSEASSRYDRPPFEPEFEKVSIHHKRAGAALQVAQKAQEISFYFRFREAEMEVGDDESRCFEHAHSLAPRPRLHKLHRYHLRYSYGESHSTLPLDNP